jgi:hypothetical protein
MGNVLDVDRWILRDPVVAHMTLELRGHSSRVSAGVTGLGRTSCGATRRVGGCP